MKTYSFGQDLHIVERKNYFEISNLRRSVFISTKQYTFGKNIVFGDRLKICNHDGSPMQELIIGDNVNVYNDTTVMLPLCTVLDYTKIHNHFYAYGTHPLSIGYNCWIGSSVILDTLGGLTIGNNVGIGSHSQIYSHVKFGDTLYGCRINSYKPVILEDDVWITPHSIITMASMKKRSMVLPGSTLAINTIENHIYAGTPAKDISHKVGKQFIEKLQYPSIVRRLSDYLREFYRIHPEHEKEDRIRISLHFPKKEDTSKTYFIAKERKYTKRLSEAEIAFIKFLLPDKAKFTPYV